MPTGRLRACKNKAKCHAINNLNLVLREYRKPCPYRIDFPVAPSLANANVKSVGREYKSSITRLFDKYDSHFWEII